jgi:LmbE family N-acetylglucosaminyl deacetylase
VFDWTRLDADDAEIGLGGYIAKTVTEGGRVWTLVASVSSINMIHTGGVVTGETREEEFKNASEVLGVEHCEVLIPGFESQLNAVPMCEFVTLLDERIEEFQPTEVLLPLPSSHQDHQYCWEVGVAATRPNIVKYQPPLIGAYGYPLSCWGAGSHLSSFYGGMYVDITKYWDAKVKALNCYVSQMRKGYSLIGLEGCAALANLRGVECGVEKAELIHVLRITVR